MRLKFRKSVASVYGSINVGSVVDIPDEVLAKKWIDAGIAVEDKGKDKAAKPRQIIPRKASKTLKEKPAEIPNGQYWCGKCSALHKGDSTIGKRHLRHRSDIVPSG